MYDEQQIIFDYGVRGNTSLYENNFNEKYSTNDGRDLKVSYKTKFLKVVKEPTKLK